MWLGLDPARTGVPPLPAGEAVPDAYARWALDAPLMLVRRPAADLDGAAPG